jgi:hypothetical protein
VSTGCGYDVPPHSYLAVFRPTIPGLYNFTAQIFFSNGAGRDENRWAGSGRRSHVIGGSGFQQHLFKNR